MNGSDHLDSVGRGERLGRILCLIPALYFFATAAYALVNFAEYAAGTARLLRYVLVPAALGLILVLAAVFTRRDTRLMVGICMSTLLATLFLFEGYISVKSLQGELGSVGIVKDDVDLAPYLQNLPPAATLKSVNNAVELKQLSKAVLAPQPKNQMFLCSLDGQPVTYEPDRLGFRNPDSVYDGDIEVLVLGDSFVEGFCLQDGEHLADQLRAYSPNLLNLGHRSAGPLFELAVLGRYGPAFEPDLTIMVFFAGNDWRNLNRELTMPWLAQALEDGVDFGPVAKSDQQIATLTDQIDQQWGSMDLSLSHYFQSRRVVRNFLALQKTAKLLGLHYPQAVAPQPEYKDILSRAEDIVAQWGGELVIVFVPPVDRFSGLISQDFLHDPLRDLVQSAADEVGLAVIDLTDQFEAHPRPKDLYASDAHFSPAGASLAAGAIAEGLQQRGFMN